MTSNTPLLKALALLERALAQTPFQAKIGEFVEKDGVCEVPVVLYVKRTALEQQFTQVTTRHDTFRLDELIQAFAIDDFESI